MTPLLTAIPQVHSHAKLVGSDSQNKEFEIFGTEYLQSLATDERRSSGQVYTPSHLVNFVLDLAGYTADNPIERMSILDPACGAGAFLTVAVKRLADRLCKMGIDVRNVIGRSYLVELVHANIRGIDVDVEACRLTRLSLHTVVSELVNTTLPDNCFSECILTADFLIDDHVEGPKEGPKSGFEYIVGNPPYVQTTRLTSEYKDELRARFETAHGRIDLYTIFMERSIGLLVKNGRMSFITPDKFLVSQSASPLRALLLSQGTITTIANFRSHKVFRGAATVPCVTVFERDGRSDEVELLQCVYKPLSDGSIDARQRSTVPKSRLRTNGWQVSSPSLDRLIAKLRSKHACLSVFAERISSGYATGKDSVFVVPPDAAQEVEAELRHPAVRGRDILPGEVATPEFEIILPYAFEAKGRPKLIRIDDYPGLKSYLEKFRDELNDRHCVRVWGKAWYDIHDPVPCDLTRQKKVLVPDIANRNRFALDEGRCCPLHSAYYIIPKLIEPDYLVAVLNSTPIEFLVRLLAPVVKDGYSRYRKQFLMDLPIPIIKTEQMIKFIAVLKQNDQDEIDRLFQKVFKLSKTDLQSIKSFLSDRLEVR